MSRSLGDLDFKRNGKMFVSAEPAVSRLALSRDVALIVLASDGLWDVMTDQVLTMTDQSPCSASPLI